MKPSKDKFSITALLLTFVGIFFIGVVIVVGILFFNEKTLVVPTVEFPEIQDAVNAAVEGDIILVKAKEDGTPYEENVSIIGEDKKNIKLIGIGKEKPVLDGDVVGGTGITITNTSGVLVKNFMIQKFVDPIVGIGIILNNSNSNMIKGNTVNGNEFGISLNQSSNSNTIKGNKANENDDRGILVNFSAKNRITGNTANENSFGIQLFNSTSHLIKGNTANGNGIDGIFLNNSENNMIIGNKANENTNGIDLQLNSDSNLIKRNIVNNTNDGIFLDVNSNNNDVFFNRAFGNGNFDIEDLDANNFKGNKCVTSNQPNICN